MVLPATTERVPQHTEPYINERIQRDMHYRLSYYAHHSGEIDKRLRQLDHEWDIERALMANASGLALCGLCMGTTLKKRYYLLSAAVLGFLFQHALEGWCPPVGLFRRLGFRTAKEIEQERSALKALRGDFGDVTPPNSEGTNVNERVDQAFRAVRQRQERQRGQEEMAPPPMPGA